MDSQDRNHVRGNMIKRAAIAILVMLLTVPAVAQTITPIAIPEWREALNGVQIDEPDSVVRFATETTQQSTNLLNSGERDKGLRLSMMGLVLSRHVSDRNERKGAPVDWNNREALNKLQAALIRGGVPQTVMKQSAVNLGVVLSETPTSLAIKARPTPRPATPVERAAMIAVIKRNLLDPTSPIFGRADVMGNQACFTVNAKNRFGGYTGNQEAVLYYNSKTKAWSGGAMIKYPHGVCLDAAN